MKRSILFLSAFAAIAAHATLFRVSCDQPDAKYRLGEIATFTVEATEKNGAAPKGMAHVRLDNFGDRIFARRYTGQALCLLHSSGEPARM